MAKYTAQLRTICESLCGLEEPMGQKSVQAILEKSAPIIFDFDYPIFDEKYKLPLEIKILKHYYMYEIGEETFGLWKLDLDDTMNRIMPYYNQLYSETLDKYGLNPFDDANFFTKRDKKDDTDSEATGKRVDTGTAKNVGHGEQETSDVAWTAFQDTPQGQLDHVDDMSYLTNATKNTDDMQSVSDTENNNEYRDNSDTENKAKILTIQDYLEHVYGKRSYTSYAELLSLWRDSFLNIDDMVLEELRNLFFLLW